MNRLLLAVAVTVAVIATTYAETACESHRRVSGANDRHGAHGLAWDIKCDANGDYEPLQCTKAPEKDKWCGCYDKEKQISGPSKKLRFCQCALAKQSAIDSGATECNVPLCARNGKFESKQCCPATGKCHCVNPETGAKTTEPTSDSHLTC